MKGRDAPDSSATDRTLEGQNESSYQWLSEWALFTRSKRRQRMLSIMGSMVVCADHSTVFVFFRSSVMSWCLMRMTRGPSCSGSNT